MVKAKRDSLAGEWDMPRHSDMREDWPFDFDVLDALPDGGASTLGPCASNSPLATHYQLGYPSCYSPAYDPALGLGWISLLTLHSHEAFNWCWHDGDNLMVFIERENLAARDFSDLKCDAG